MASPAGPPFACAHRADMPPVDETAEVWPPDWMFSGVDAEQQRVVVELEREDGRAREVADDGDGGVHPQCYIRVCTVPPYIPKGRSGLSPRSFECIITRLPHRQPPGVSSCCADHGCIYFCLAADSFSLCSFFTFAPASQLVTALALCLVRATAADFASCAALAALMVALSRSAFSDCCF